MDPREYPKMIYKGEVGTEPWIIVNNREEEEAQREAWSSKPEPKAGKHGKGESK